VKEEDEKEEGAMAEDVVGDEAGADAEADAAMFVDDGCWSRGDWIPKL